MEVYDPVSTANSDLEKKYKKIQRSQRLRWIF